MNYTILTGDNRVTLKTLADNSIDAIITDPPYGIDFLGKSWDANTGAVETYQECLRVLKPGGHILAFSAARTYHHLAVTLEQAGFEIRDQIMWIYSSGFPKAQAVQGFDGWKTALKPAHEPIALARKPIKTSTKTNMEKWAVGALNIDATRVPYADAKDIETYLNNKKGPMERSTAVDGEGIGMFEGKVGYKTIKREVSAEEDLPEQGRFPSNVIGEIAEPYQKYFYCPKVSRKERHIGHTLPEAEPLNSPDQVRNHPLWDPSIGTNAHRLKEKIRKSLAPTGHIKGPYDENGNRLAVTLDNANLPGNNHPTVKPIALMKYLIKLITPPGGTVLDPFNGSGSTGCAAVELGHTYIGCELDPKYVEIARKRIEAWYEATRDPAKDIFE